MNPAVLFFEVLRDIVLPFGVLSVQVCHLDEWGDAAVCDNFVPASAVSTRESAPLAAALAPELRDWSRGMEQGLLTLLEGLEARREK